MMAPGTQSRPVFEFLTTTIPFHEATDEESRRIVRSHAIRDANRRKRLGVTSEGKSRVAAPAAQSKFTAKFRLQTAERTPKPKILSKDSSQGNKGNSRGMHSLKWRQQSLLFVPDVGNLDPFETFPIKLGPKQQALMHYRMYLSIQLF